MIRRFAFAALLFGAVACGDDSDDPKPTPDAGGTPDSGAPAYVPVPNRVTNAGVACTAPSSGCEGGEGKTCLTTVSLAGTNTTYPGGYCSATCQANIECGTGSECPVGESLKMSPFPLPAGASGFVPSNCYKTCTTDADCRGSEKYRCSTIVSAITSAGGGGGGGAFDISAIIGLLPGPIKTNLYCLPPAPPPPDGGVGDGGAADGGVDAAAADAATTDAAATDAATTDATTDAT